MIHRVNKYEMPIMNTSYKPFLPPKSMLNKYAIDIWTIEDYDSILNDYILNHNDVNVFKLLLCIQTYIYSPIYFFKYGEEEKYYKPFVVDDNAVSYLFQNKRGACRMVLDIVKKYSENEHLLPQYYVISAQSNLILGDYDESLKYYIKLLNLTSISSKKKKYDDLKIDGDATLLASIVHNIQLLYSLKGDFANVQLYQRNYAYVFDYIKNCITIIPKIKDTKVDKYTLKKYLRFFEQPLKTIFLEASCYTGKPFFIDSSFQKNIQEYVSLDAKIACELQFDKFLEIEGEYIYSINDEYVYHEKPDCRVMCLHDRNTFFSVQSDYIDENEKQANTEVVQPAETENIKEILQDNSENSYHNASIQVQDEDGQKTFDSLLSELHSLIGLNEIKEDVENLINLVRMQKYREKNGLKTVPVTLHLVFTGNPGTGKTTVARILAQLYKEIGVIKTGQLVEVDRSGLVAGYVGQTAIKTQEKIKEAMGGILFIDEAYSLAKEGNDYGQEAIDTILKAMEDHRDDFVVIVAGYSEPMEKFINSNPGLQSRFNKFFHFPDYSSDEMIQIFYKICREYDYQLTEDADEEIRNRIIDLERNKTERFANARDVRNMFEKIIVRQSSRVSSMRYPTKEDAMTIIFNDVKQ